MTLLDPTGGSGCGLGRGLVEQQVQGGGPVGRRVHPRYQASLKVKKKREYSYMLHYET